MKVLQSPKLGLNMPNYGVMFSTLYGKSRGPCFRPAEMTVPRQIQTFILLRALSVKVNCLLLMLPWNR